MSIIRTFTGKRVDVLNVRVKNIDLRDIAHGLAFKCRFNGHTKEFYSVAEHSVRVLREVQRLAGRNITRNLALNALFHDAAETYLPDIPNPYKHFVEIDDEPVTELEGRIMRMVARKYHGKAS